MDIKGNFLSTIRGGLGGPPRWPIKLLDSPGGPTFYRDGWTFGFFPHAGWDDAEYYVSGIDEEMMTPWSINDHPELVFELVELEREEDSSRKVTQEAMARFLARYGPLTPSYLPEGEGLYSEKVRRLNLAGDFRCHDWMFGFSEPVYRLRLVVETMEKGELDDALRSCLLFVDESPRGTLYRELLLELLALILERRAPRRCAGCGKWFTETDDESTARHRQGWKRSDAKYHSKRCMKAAKERERRARLKQKKEGMKPSRTNIDEGQQPVRAAAVHPSGT